LAATAVAGVLLWISEAGAAGLPGYPYSQRITLNTTSAGAGITADVPGYPLAVTLKDDFPFAQARDNGEDIRFTDAAGNPLPFEIESWDKAAKRAALWVKVDVKGNQDGQAILLHWGSGGTSGAGDGRAVFDEASGYLGAWHLGQDAGVEADGFRDASWNAAHGTGVLVPKGAPADGRIGKGTLLVNPKGGASGKIQWVEVAGDKVIKEFGAEELTTQ